MTIDLAGILYVRTRLVDSPGYPARLLAPQGDAHRGSADRGGANSKIGRAHV